MSRGEFPRIGSGAIRSDSSVESGRTSPAVSDVFESSNEAKTRVLSSDERLTELRKIRDAKRKELSEEVIKYTYKSQGMLGVRLLRERKDEERAKVFPDAKLVVELNQRIAAEEQSRLIVNHRHYQERVRDIRGKIGALRALNRVNKDSPKIKRLQEEIRGAVAELEAYDKKLRKEYEGVEPYPRPLGRAQGIVDTVKSWFTEVDIRPSSTELLMEYSLATHGLKQTDDAYVKVFEQFSQPSLDDIWKFIDDHPVLASQMASKFGQMAILLSGDSSAGALIQNAIAQKRYEYRTMDLLRGKDYQHAYAEEFENPLTVSQIALIDMLSKAPYVLAAVQGAQGKTMGGALGFSVGGVVGGAAGAMAEMTMQNVLAESLDRDFEVWASALSFSFSEGDLGAVLNADLTQIVPAVWSFMKPGFRAFSQKGQAEKMHQIVKDTVSEDWANAMYNSAKSTFSKPLSDEVVTPETAPIIFVINLSKFLRAYRLADFRPDFGNAHYIYDLVKNIDAKPGQILQGTRGVLNTFVSPEWMAWLESNKHILTKLPIQALKSITIKE